MLQGLLKDGCARANEEMIGIVTPAERLKRRICASLVLLAIVVTMTIVFRKIMQAFTARPIGQAAGQVASTWLPLRLAYAAAAAGGGDDARLAVRPARCRAR